MEISSRSGIIILFATVAVCTLVLFPLLQYVAERDPQLSAYDDDWNDISNSEKAWKTIQIQAIMLVQYCQILVYSMRFQILPPPYLL